MITATTSHTVNTDYGFHKGKTDHITCNDVRFKLTCAGGHEILCERECKNVFDDLFEWFKYCVFRMERPIEVVEAINNWAYQKAGEQAQCCDQLLRMEDNINTRVGELFTTLQNVRSTPVFSNLIRTFADSCYACQSANASFGDSEYSEVQHAYNAIINYLIGLGNYTRAMLATQALITNNIVNPGVDVVENPQMQEAIFLQMQEVIFSIGSTKDESYWQNSYDTFWSEVNENTGWIDIPYDPTDFALNNSMLRQGLEIPQSIFSNMLCEMARYNKEGMSGNILRTIIDGNTLERDEDIIKQLKTTCITLYHALTHMVSTKYSQYVETAFAAYRTTCDRLIDIVSARNIKEQVTFRLAPLLAEFEHFVEELPGETNAQRIVNRLNQGNYANTTIQTNMTQDMVNEFSLIHAEYSRLVSLISKIEEANAVSTSAVRGVQDKLNGMISGLQNRQENLKKSISRLKGKPLHNTILLDITELKTDAKCARIAKNLEEIANLGRTLNRQ